MIRRVPRFHRDNFQGQLSNPPRLDARIRNQVDNLGVARCPLCGYGLVVRQDCRGPYFFCLCVKPRRRLAA